LEGFLCPLCMKDLGDVIQLQIHFDEAHSKEDQAFVQSLKDLFGKAKKILAEDSNNQENDHLTGPKLKLAPSEDDRWHPVSGIHHDVFPGQETSQLSSQSHINEFKKIRSSRVDRYATETNRLIVRLDKLLDQLPGEASKRREQERQVVPWIDEDLVKLCPSCARSFNIARRKHHCRLCGCVMCQDCSDFVDFNFCRKLVNPSNLSSYKMVDRQGWNVNSRNSDTRSMGSPAQRSSGMFKLRKSGSRESLSSAVMGSMVLDSRLKDEFRCCGYCKSLLQHRDTMLELATSEPIIAQFYVKLREYVKLGEEMSPQYMGMYESLMLGDTTYHSSDVKLLRVKLLKVAENIDLMSKKIQALGSEQLSEVPEGVAKPRKFVLQDQVRRASVNFIKETLVGLPSLPSDDELAKIQERRKEEIARRVQEERKRAEEMRLKYQNLQEKKKTIETGKIRLSPSGSKFNQSNVSYESGFVLSSSAQQREIVSVVSDDPMLQQIQIITGYIAQARQANRFDEVHMLETNLKMLEEEFRKQRIHQENELLETEPTTSDNSGSQSSGYVSFKPSSSAKNNEDEVSKISNPFNSDSDDEYDASGKNPFAE